MNYVKEMINLLYTTKEIAKLYGGEQQNVTPYMITHTWIPNGLKYIKGKRQSYLFKLEWVEQYLEEHSQMAKVISKKMISTNRRTKKVTNNNMFVH